MTRNEWSNALQKTLNENKKQGGKAKSRKGTQEKEHTTTSVEEYEKVISNLFTGDNFHDRLVVATAIHESWDLKDKSAIQKAALRLAFDLMTEEERRQIMQ